MINDNHLDNLEIITGAPNGIKLLRQLILKNAISGKLVTQDSDEGTGFELITKILDNRGIEVGAENKPTSSIPTNWGRAKLGEIFYLEMGQSPNSDSYNSRGEGLPFYQGKTDFGSFAPIPRVWCSSPTKVAEVGDVLLSVRAPVGPTNYADEKCCIGRGLAAVRPLGGMQTEFVLWWLRAYESQIAEMGTGTTFIAVSKKNLEPFMIAIPPLAEQSRILDRIKELMKQCDILESQFGLQDSLSTAARNSAIDAISTAQTTQQIQIAWERIQSNWEVFVDSHEAIALMRKLVLNLGLAGELIDKLESFDFSEMVALGSNKKQMIMTDVHKVRNSRGDQFFTAIISSITEVIPQSLSKIKSSAIQEMGQYPVVDQGKAFIAGYVDKVEPIKIVDAPVIIFGDHTRNIKYVDFDFVVGADGVKILRPYFLNPKYLYYMAQGIDLQSRGYGRHFRQFCDSRIPIISKEDQVKTVRIIEEIFAICEKLEKEIYQRELLAERFARSVVSESAQEIE